VRGEGEGCGGSHDFRERGPAVRGGGTAALAYHPNIDVPRRAFIQPRGWGYFVVWSLYGAEAISQFYGAGLADTVSGCAIEAGAGNAVCIKGDSDWCSCPGGFSDSGESPGRRGNRA